MKPRSVCITALWMVLLGGCVPQPGQSTLTSTATLARATPTLSATPDLCAGVAQWASDASSYDTSVGDACSQRPGQPIEEMKVCRQTAASAWESLTGMSLPPIATAAHDLLRRAMVSMVQSADAYLRIPMESYYQIFYVDSVDMRREYRVQRDLILRLCGDGPPEIPDDAEVRHAIEDIRQRQMLTNDPAAYERWGLEWNRVSDVLRARPEADRQGAIALVKSIAGQDAVVVYLHTQQTRESYAVGQTLFEIERATDTLTMINEVQRDAPTDPKRVLDMTPRFSGDELEQMARTFVATYAPAVDLATLVLERHYDQGSQYYWFRWNLQGSENRGRHVQIAYTPAGEIVAYSITLPGY